MSRKPSANQKRNFSAMTLSEAMKLIGQESLIHWKLEGGELPPSETLNIVLGRLQSFDIGASEQSKTLLIDALFLEIVPNHQLKVWKEVTLNTTTLTGVADYVFAPNRAYMEEPMLCVTEAKKR